MLTHHDGEQAAVPHLFSMKRFLPEAVVTKLLLDSAHDAMPYYEYCRDHGIIPFIDLNADRGRPPVYKDDFTINNDGVPICRDGHVMRRDGTESAKGRTKFKCPKMKGKTGRSFSESAAVSMYKS